jgi:protein TonB
MQPEREPGLNPRLLLAITVSLVIHGAVLALVGFRTPAPPAPEREPLHMVEYPLPAAEEAPKPAPEDRPAAASRTRQARGDHSERRVRTSPDSGPPSPRPQRSPPPPEPTGKPDRAAEEGTDPTGPTAEREAADEPSSGAPPDSPDRDLALYPSRGELAHWSRERRETRARGATEGPARTATREDQRAAYLAGWLSKVQRVGSYPEEAQERDIRGSVRLLVRIAPDGRLLEVRVLEGSGSRLLDRAALRTIRRGAPYSRLPDSLAEGGLTIRPRLSYTRGGELVSR